MGGITVDIGTTEGPGPWREVLYVVIVLLIAILGFGIMYGWKISIDSRTKECISELKELDQKLGQFKLIVKRYQTAKDEIKFIASQAQKLRELKYEPLQISYILREIPELLPPGTWISNLTINADKHNIKFSTYAASSKKQALQLVAQLLDKISTNPFFTNPKIGNINLRSENGVPIASFSVSIDYKISITSLEEQSNKGSSENTEEESNK